MKFIEVAKGVETNPVLAALLVREGVVEQFVSNVVKPRPMDMNDAFIWENSPEGHEFWSEIHVEERRTIRRMKQHKYPNGWAGASMESIEDEMLKYYMENVDTATIKRRYQRAI